MKISDEMREALQSAKVGMMRERFSDAYANAMIAAVAPLILEEAAKVAESKSHTVAAAIRDLISEPQTAPHRVVS